MARRAYRREPKERLDVNPEIGRGLLAILLFVVSGLSILSFFSLAGVAGHFIDALLAVVFGQVRYVFPIILLLVAALMVKEMDYEYRPSHIIGAILFFLSFNGLVHLQKPLEEMYSLSMQGYGGGLSGLALAWPLGRYIGYWGGLIILAGLLLTSVIFLLNTSLPQLIGFVKNIFWFIGGLFKKLFGLIFGPKNPNAPVKVKVNGDYEQTEEEEDEDDEDEDEEEEKPAFRRVLIKEKDEDEEEEKENDLEKKLRLNQAKIKFYKLPTLELLTTSKSKPTSGDIKSNAQTIKETLQNFGIEVDMGEIQVGPTVTQYSFKPAKGVKLSRITGLSNDLALALAAHPIRIEAPIPGKALVGIEVPNERVAMVTLKELLESKEYEQRKHNLMIALGKDVAGKVWFADLPKMPHLLIAGATGSGKTVCINTVILSLLYQNTPENLRIIMVDPKRVELTLYNGIPHLLTPVITDAAKTVNALRWTINEMDRRFDVLSKAAKRDIASYNQVAQEKLPHIVFVIDELADLMAAAASEVEAGIIRLAQMARAVGIHLIVATQRPSVEVITGLMKANIPARIAFSVASLIDSRTILDCPGAEKLLGRGDMLYLTAELSKPKRLQGAFVSEEELKRVVDFLKGDEPPEYVDDITTHGASGGGSSGGNSNSLFGGNDYDSLFEEAKRVVIESGKASASLLQRRMKVGYARAARILDEMEEAGIIGPADGAKPREVFTEHLMPSPERELDDKEQTMDAGGTVFEEKEETVDEEVAEEDAEETDEEDTEEIEEEAQTEEETKETEPQENPKTAE